MSTSTSRKSTTGTKQAAASVVLVVVVCGVFSDYFIEDVVGAIGRFARHDELALRLLGWCWGAGPWIGWTLLISCQDRLSERTRHYLGLGLLIWAATGALHLSGRLESTKEHYLSVWPDGVPLGYGWTWGVVVLFVFLFLLAVVAGVRRKDKTKLVPLSRGAMVTWVILLAASLAAALLAPRP